METVRQILKAAFPDKEVAVFENIDSTNKFLKEHIDYDVAVAMEQDAGRGRLGRSFSSARGGMYFSFSADPSAYRLATVAAAVAVCDVLEEFFGISANVKWVNDIIVNGKKICGILAESNLPKSLIIGIGINATNKLPTELENIATTLESVLSKEIPQTVFGKVPALIIKRFEALILENDTLLIEMYKRRINYFGSKITVIQNGKTRICVAKDVDVNGNLLVEEKDGSITALSSAEISTKI